MSTNNWSEHAGSLARWTGLLLIAMTVSAILAEFVARGSLFVAGDATETAGRILAAPGSFRTGLFAYLVTFLLDVPVAVLLYLLFREVHRGQAVMALAFRLVYTAIIGAFLLHYASAGMILNDGALAATLGSDELNGLAYLAMLRFDLGFLLSLVFFGFHLLFLGLLIVRSGLLPVWLGWLTFAGGISYIVAAPLKLLAPSLHSLLTPVLVPLGMAELLLAFWLLLRGLRRPASATVGQ